MLYVSSIWATVVTIFFDDLTRRENDTDPDKTRWKLVQQFQNKLEKKTKCFQLHFWRSDWRKLRQKKMEQKLVGAFILIILVPTSVLCVPFVVQTLSSRYAIILGGYAYQYEELSEVDIVRHDKVCHNVIRWVHGCVRLKIQGGRVTQIFAKILGGVNALLDQIDRGAPILGFIVFLLTSFLQIYLWGSMLYPLTHFTPPRVHLWIRSQ